MARQLPRDENGTPVQLTPSSVALGRFVSSSISSSTTRDLTAATATAPQTTMIRVYAISQDIYLKWGSTAVSASNFDEVIPAGQIVDLVVPIDTTTGALFTTLRVIERTATATIILIEK
jgi:hypothetical protein